MDFKQLIRQYPLAVGGFGSIILGLIVNSTFLIFLGFIVLYIFFSQAKKKGTTNNFDIKKIFSKFNFNSGKPMETINPKRGRRIGFWIVLLVLFFVFLSFVSAFWVVVEAGETGVRSFFGKVQDNEFHSGFHLKNPLEKVTKMSIRTQDYTMSVAQGEGEREGADAITALTKEGLSVDLDITILYHLMEEKASDVYRDVGFMYDETIIRPAIRAVIREVIAQYDAKDIYSEKRQEAVQQIITELTKKLEPRGIELEDVLLRHVQLPADLAGSIQQKLQAEQEAQRYDFILQTEQKEAERKRIEAEGQRDAQQIINQSLTPNYLNYLYIQNLENRAGTIYVPTNPSTGVPLFRGL
ncbi:MAG TPA: hypothetical protein DCS29_04040 [Candidatus Magasanikbacteria bacterium]|nr:MAG: hypothetical protein A2479_01020 [Candidatus Magasanikbacteria bacterium RIFOXYC2_FULL_39_8]HAT03914.1 hypothetical protein [Candidatus Magasanikbacteria bacterium]